MKIKFVTLLFLALILTNCKGKTEETTTTSQETAFASINESLEPQDFLDKLSQSPNAQLIDVRTPEEFKSKHIDNAVNIDFNNSNFDSQIAKLEKDKPVFVYCLSGGRSKAAASKLQEAGFKEIYELDGGMLKWNAANLSPTTNNKGKGMTLTDFEKITRSDKKVVVDFNATWCGPCQKMSPYLDKMKEELKDKGINIVKIDVDENEQLAADMKIDGIPHIMIFNNGKKVWENVGYISEEELRKKL